MPKRIRRGKKVKIKKEKGVKRVRRRRRKKGVTLSKLRNYLKKKNKVVSKGTIWVKPHTRRNKKTGKTYRVAGFWRRRGRRKKKSGRVVVKRKKRLGYRRRRRAKVIKQEPIAIKQEPKSNVIRLPELPTSVKKKSLML